MVTTLDIVAAFFLGGIVEFGTVGAIGGYFWARADVRRAVFKLLHQHWPDDYHSVCHDQF